MLSQCVIVLKLSVMDGQVDVLYLVLGSLTTVILDTVLLVGNSTRTCTSLGSMQVFCFVTSTSHYSTVQDCW